MEEGVAAAACASLAGGRLFCGCLRRSRVMFLRLPHLFGRTPEEFASGGVWLPPSPPTFGGLICPWAEETLSGAPGGPADVLQARPRLPRPSLQFSFISLVRRTESLLVDLALEALRRKLGV